MNLIFVLYQLQDYKDIVSTNDATVQGILIGMVISLGAVVVFLYRKDVQTQKDRITELKTFNEALIRVNNSYNEFVNNFVKYQKDVREN